MSKAREIKDMSLEELEARQKQLQESLFNLRFQHGTNQLENPMRMGQTRKDIARVKTIIAQKKLAAVKAEG